MAHDMLQIRRWRLKNNPEERAEHLVEFPNFRKAPIGSRDDLHIDDNVTYAFEYSWTSSQLWRVVSIYIRADGESPFSCEKLGDPGSCVH